MTFRSKCLLLILTAALLRLSSLVMPHAVVDQLQYAALAMKLQDSGLKDYSLRGVQVKVHESGWLTGLFPAGEGRGNGLDLWPDYYDAPLFHKPPLFPVLLAVSHRVFSFGKPMMLASWHPGKAVSLLQLIRQAGQQWSVVCISIIASLGWICFTVLIGARLYHRTVGLLAGWIAAFSPLALFTSHRVWADDVLTLCVAAGVLCYIIARQRTSAIWFGLAGVMAGLAALTKPSGHIAILILIAHWGLQQQRPKEIMWTLILWAAVSWPWYGLVSSVYGSPFYAPVLNVESFSPGSWEATVRSRSWWIYIVNPLVQMPIFILAWVMIIRGIIVQPRQTENSLLILWALVPLAVFYFWPGRELRYLLPAYPALALLSARQLWEWGKTRPVWMVTGLVFGCAVWGAVLGWPKAFSQSSLLILPF